VCAAMETPLKKLKVDGSGGSGMPHASEEQRVLTNAALEFPVLSRSNYHEWALVMQVNRGDGTVGSCGGRKS
jgi:hypothetical protein